MTTTRITIECNICKRTTVLPDDYQTPAYEDRWYGYYESWLNGESRNQCSVCRDRYGDDMTEDAIDCEATANRIVCEYDEDVSLQMIASLPVYLSEGDNFDSEYGHCDYNVYNDWKTPSATLVLEPLNSEESFDQEEPLDQEPSDSEPLDSESSDSEESLDSEPLDQEPSEQDEYQLYWEKVSKCVVCGFGVRHKLINTRAWLPSSEAFAVCPGECYKKACPYGIDRTNYDAIFTDIQTGCTETSHMCEDELYRRFVCDVAMGRFESPEKMMEMAVRIKTYIDDNVHKCRWYA